MPNVLNVMDRTGDSRIEWNPNVPAEVEMARAAFNAAKDKKYLTYRLDGDGNRGEVLREFDPGAARIVASPQPQGG
jgi:hypothetical protein